MVKKKTKTKITTESLVLMVAKGFENTATKDDLKEFATKQEMREGFQIVNDTLGLIRDDIRDLKISVEIDLKDLKNRVERLEKKVGIMA